MKISFGFLILFFSLMNCAVAGNSSTHFSPYADLTINAHWDSQYQDMEPFDLNQASKESGIKSYHLAFITDAGACTPAWGSQASYSAADGWGSHLTDTLRANGVSYIIAFGGASGDDLSKNCNESQLVAAYEKIIATYQPQGLDFDIENGTANVARVMTVLKVVQANHPNLKISFTLPVLPEGLIDSGKEIVNLAAVNGLTFSVNIMAMDFGPAYVNDMGQYSIQSATNLFLFLKTVYPGKSDADLWKMVEVTPMIGVNDVNVEQFTLGNVDTLRNFAKQNNLGGLSMWSVARDNPCADKWASPVCSGNNLQSHKYEFAERFLL